MSHVMCHVSFVIDHVLTIICYMSHVTCHISHVTFFFSPFFYKVVDQFFFLYQWGLPCLVYNARFIQPINSHQLCMVRLGLISCLRKTLNFLMCVDSSTKTTLKICSLCHVSCVKCHMSPFMFHL